MKRERCCPRKGNWHYWNGPEPPNKKPELNATAYAKDSAYEFQNLRMLPKAPTGTTEAIVKARAARKALLKGLVKSGKKNMRKLLKLRKAAKKYIKEKEWDTVKKIAARIDKFEDKMDKWMLERDAAFALKAVADKADGWHDQHVDFKDSVNEAYAKKQAARTKNIRKKFLKYLKAKKADKVVRMKAKALKALNSDLKALKGRAMQAFAARFKAALVKKFGAKKINKALKKGRKAAKKALKGKKGKKGSKGKKGKKGSKKAKKAVNARQLALKYLKKATKGQAHVVLIAVAAHLPTVGPYIRAGLVSDEAGRAAMKPLVRRW